MCKVLRRKAGHVCREEAHMRGSDNMQGESTASAFPDRLRKLRERKRMSRAALGECCGMSKNVIGQYERGEREPMASSLVKMADFFEVSTDYLVGRQNFM